MKLDFFFFRINLKMFFHLIYEIGLNFNLFKMWVVQFHSVAQSCPTVCDPGDYSPLGFPVHHQLPELAPTHVHRVGDAIQPSPPLLSLSPPTFIVSHQQGLFQRVISSHQVAKVLELQLQYQSFQ